MRVESSTWAGIVGKSRISMFAIQAYKYCNYLLIPADAGSAFAGSTRIPSVHERLLARTILPFNERINENC